MTIMVKARPALDQDSLKAKETAFVTLADQWRFSL
jgi:hypothetical protein